MPFKLFSRNVTAATQARRVRFAAALLLTVSVGVSADAYKQAQLRHNIAPGVENMPAALLPKPSVAAPVYSRVVWIDNDTFLHLQSIPDADNVPGARSQISLTRYRYVIAGGSATLHKEQEYSWPFDRALTFAHEPASEIRLSPDKKNLLVPLSRIKERSWEGSHYVGRVALSTKGKVPESAYWELQTPLRTLTSYRFLWLPDSQHFVVVFESEAIDLFDIRQNAAGVRIAADPMVPGSHNGSITKVFLRDKEVVGFTPDSELVLRPKPFFAPANKGQIKFLALEKVPLSAQGVKPGHQHIIPVNTTAIDIQDALLSSDGKRLLFRGFFPAPRPDNRWQSFIRPAFVSQYATLDLQTGAVTPLVAENIYVRPEPNASCFFSANISWRNRTSNMNFTPQWLPGSSFISVAPDDTATNRYAVWRVPVANW